MRVGLSIGHDKPPGTAKGSSRIEMVAVKNNEHCYNPTIRFHHNQLLINIGFLFKTKFLCGGRTMQYLFSKYRIVYPGI